jgi:FixJ family two-component response regulator
MSATLNIIHPSTEECRNLALAMASQAADARTFESAEEFLQQVTPDENGCVVAPDDLPGMGTRALIEAIRARRLPLRVVVLGSSADIATAVELVRAGASEYLEPPVSPRRLRSVVRDALATSHG